MSRLIKVKTDHASKGVIRMNKEKFLRCAVTHLENELSATKKELAELKASLPQIKHDAIIEAADAFFRTEEYTLAVRTEVVGYMRCYAIRQ